MGMDRMGGGMPPADGGGMMPSGSMIGAGGPKTGGLPDLQTLWEMLPKQYQSKLDPKNPITALHFNRLRSLSDQQGDALLSFMAKASAPEIGAFKAAFPELDLLLDIFDDGEINNSVGHADGADASAGSGREAMPGKSPQTGRMGEGPGADGTAMHEAGESADYEAEEPDEEMESYNRRPGSRLNSIRA